MTAAVVVLVLGGLALALLLIVLMALGDALLHGRTLPYPHACDRCPENPANYGRPGA